MTQHSFGTIADRFFEAIESTDLEVVEALYSSDASVWHSYDNLVQTRTENIAVIASFPVIFSTFKYCEIRRHFFEDGLVQQHVLRGTTKAGVPFALFACMVITIWRGQISHIDEYFDTAQVPDSALPSR
jgi:ketosteroid isomerase-like protein